MPSYEFQCQICNKTEEVFARFEETFTPPKCCGAEMSRKFSASGIVFKGDGWAGKS